MRREYVPGALRALAADPALELILVGKPESSSPRSRARMPTLRARARACFRAATVVGMSEHPREAIRRRKDSSMRLAIDLVKEGRAAAMVSAGNTGALTAMAHFVLKTVGPRRARAHHVRRCRRAMAATRTCSISARIPRPRRCSSRSSPPWASIVARDVFGIANPRVGLLNIGEEETKGHELVQDAHELIRASGVNYVGFVEGNDIFDGNVDVVVTDGFTGNVALKTMEGLAKLIVEQMRAEFTRDPLSKTLRVASAVRC